MDKILNPDEAKTIFTDCQKNKKSTVLVGGCFDVVHIGHVRFLQEAKKLGDILFVFLESDEKVRRLKGENRPLFKQSERAIVLSAISYVDYVITLPFISTDEGYNELVLSLKPDIIAVTENDPHLGKKKKQADLIKGKLEVVPFVKTFSSSKLVKVLGIE
jgi:D-beta-D-heptose 7-phosphate kinase/D-beta-D-heptose 1-phosphate adenosyltransferase